MHLCTAHGGRAGKGRSDWAGRGVSLLAAAAAGVSSVLELLYTRVRPGQLPQCLASKHSPLTWMRESIIKSTAVNSSSFSSSSLFKGRAGSVMMLGNGAAGGGEGAGRRGRQV